MKISKLCFLYDRKMLLEEYFKELCKQYMRYKQESDRLFGYSKNKHN